MVWTFVPVAFLLTLSPGPAFALVVRTALAADGRSAVLAILGNGVGVITWALLSIAGITALIAASEAAFAVLRVAGAAVLVVLGVQYLRAARRAEDGKADPGRDLPPPSGRGPFRDGLLTGVANPKLAVFFVALFPQFVPEGSNVLAATLLMGLLVVTFDLLWYGSVAFGVARAKRAFVGSRLARRIEQITGTVLIGLGLRMAVERN
jgi:threonine/homoserine/homoserine lactone efflux protein